MRKKRLLKQAWDHPLLRSADPQVNSLIRLYRLDPPLNPFTKNRIVIDAAVAYGDLPNVKMIPAFHMLAKALENGRLDGVHTIVEPTSGNFGSSVGLLASAFGIEHTVLYVKKDAPPGKIHTIEALPGVSIYKYDPGKGENGLALAKREAERSGVICLNQYGNWDNVQAHMKHTGPAIWETTQGMVTVLVAAAGSGGTLGGAGLFLKSKNPRIKTVRAVVSPGEEIPAGRTLKQIEEIVTIDYPPGTFDYTVPCGRHTAFLAALALGKQVHARPGPTSGEAYQVALTWLEERVRAGELDAMRNQNGFVHVVVVCPDSIELYAERVSGGTNYEQVR
mgnify:CR=1 FL=1